MAVLISKQGRLGLGLNTLTRNIVFAILALRGLTRAVPAYKDFVNIATTSSKNGDTINATLNARVKLLVQAEAVGTEGFNRLDYIKNLSELTPDNPPALVAVEGVSPLPDNPEGLTLEKFIYWAGIVLGCSTYPSTDYYIETFEDKPSTGDPYLTLEFVIPLDYRRYLLRQNAIAAAIEPFTVYVTDPGSLPSTPWVIPPSSQYWKDPVSDLAALTALTGLPIGVSVPVLSEGGVFTLISALPDGETLGEKFLEPDTQSATEVWARSVGKAGPQGEPGTPGAGVAWRGEWYSGTAYIAQDAVGHLGSSWIANAPNTNKTPGTDPEWDLWISKGNPGATGADGAAGNDGLTAYEVAVLNGFEGTEPAWLASLKGPPGDSGPAGTISAAGSIALEQIATPSAPSAGNTLIYAKTDGGIYKRAAGGNEEAIGSGGGNGNFSPLTDKALYYYDAGSGLFKPVGIGTLDQVLVAKPSSNPPYQWATPTGREALTANRTYYVRTDGNDSNNGLTNTAGGAFLTWQKAESVLSKLDGNGYEVTLKGTGNCSEKIILNSQYIGIKNITIDGDITTPSNCTITEGSGGYCITIATFTPVYIKGLKLISSNSGGIGIAVFKGDCFLSGNCDFGNCAFSHIYVSGGKSQFNQQSGYIISGNANSHIECYDDASYDANFNPATITLSGTRTFSQFLMFGRSANGLFVNCTYSGSATGLKYNIASMARVTAAGTTFPGTGQNVTSPGFYG